MKYLRGFFALALLLTACSSPKAYDPNDLLTPQQKDAILTSIIRYVAKAPEGVSNIEKFDAKHDAYYQEKISQARFEKYAIKGLDYYFLVSQRAPSITDKRHATGGRFRLNDNGKFTEYEEIFRTWKMVPDTLARRSSMLFDKMVKGESLEPYLTKNSNVEYIEFPDDRTYYDMEIKEWKLK